jgi:hypothetical protein
VKVVTTGTTISDTSDGTKKYTPTEAAKDKKKRIQ